MTRWIWFQDGKQDKDLAQKVLGSNDIGVYVLLHHLQEPGQPNSGKKLAPVLPGARPS